jgi:hypothetical protein
MKVIATAVIVIIIIIIIIIICFTVGFYQPVPSEKLSPPPASSWTTNISSPVRLVVLNVLGQS